MSPERAIERAARQMAERRVPGSTRDGGHYHLSEAWRTMIRRSARTAVLGHDEDDAGASTAVPIAVGDAAGHIDAPAAVPPLGSVGP